MIECSKISVKSMNGGVFYGKKQADEMAKVAQKNVDKAIDYIIGSMTAKYDK